MAAFPVPNPPINAGNVDDVQELRKNQPNIIPERFVRDITERPTLGRSLSASLSIMPSIDFFRLTRGNKEEILYEISRLAYACEKWGFFQLLSAIDGSFMESIEESTREFFMLPLEEKKKYALTPGTVQGYGQAFVFSEDQKLDWCNMLGLVIKPDFLRYSHLWPKRPANFSETVEEYSKEVRKVCQTMLKYIAIGLGLKGDVFEKMFGEAMQAVRINYYPPCSRPDLVLGLSPHSDGSALSVLHQSSGSPVGLQILKDDTWVPVNSMPYGLIMNIGDTMEVLTNGKYKSVEHRVVVDEERDRLSIASYYAPSHEVEISPMPQFVNQNNPRKFRSYNHGEYTAHYAANRLQGKKALDFAKI
ncbi:protein SRG1-like [Abrus precatorius]|uniref:Protein SRG1-like n=1 Tax=Abrus precatorius TaxID=3816 RepID=A0A8B8MJC4_ABRPR|nr:protein SRG1-like [Abrus precatorius]